LNKDGVIDASESKLLQDDYKANKGGAVQILKRYDANNDGIIDASELKVFHSDLSSLAKSERHSVPTTAFAVGGHDGIGKVIRKPVNTCEGEFYRNLSSIVGDALRFFPLFYGLVQVTPDSPAYMFMDDITAGCRRPAVCDIKIGKQTYLPNSRPEKVKNMGKKDANTTSCFLGSRLTGYNYFKKDGSSYKVLKEDTFIITTREQYIEHLKIFFNDGVALRTDVITCSIPFLIELLEWKENTCRLNFYSSSLLFVYDVLNHQPHGRVKLIDMANMCPTPEGEVDENFNFGLRKLIELFQFIVQEGPAYVTPDEPRQEHVCPQCGHHYSHESNHD